MSLTIVDAHETITGSIRVIFGTDQGLDIVEGTREEIERLARVMTQVAALGELNTIETCWIESVVVGKDIVQLGLLPRHRIRMSITRDAIW